MAGEDLTEEQTAELALQMRELEAEERRDFIRAAAVAVAAAVDHNGNRAFAPHECWERARALWALKPEGC